MIDAADCNCVGREVWNSETQICGEEFNLMTCVRAKGHTGLHRACCSYLDDPEMDEHCIEEWGDDHSCECDDPQPIGKVTPQYCGNCRGWCN